MARLTFSSTLFKPNADECGTAYDWFNFLIKGEIQVIRRLPFSVRCVDVMEPLGGAEEEPEKFFGCDQRSIAMKEERKKGKKGKKEEEGKEK